MATNLKGCDTIHDRRRLLKRTLHSKKNISNFFLYEVFSHSAWHVHIRAYQRVQYKALCIANFVFIVF